MDGDEGEVCLTWGAPLCRLETLEKNCIWARTATYSHKQEGEAAMSESGRSVIVDVQDVKMVYNSKSRDESTHVHALRGLSVQVYENEFFAIMGPSGSGKSTLFNMIGAADAHGR